MRGRSTYYGKSMVAGSPRDRDVWNMPHRPVMVGGVRVFMHGNMCMIAENYGIVNPVLDHLVTEHARGDAIFVWIWWINRRAGSGRITGARVQTKYLDRSCRGPSGPALSLDLGIGDGRVASCSACRAAGA